MLQRIQTVYLLLVIASLLIITLGVHFFAFTVKKENTIELSIKVNVFGTQADAILSDNLNEAEEEKISQFLKLKERTKRVSSKPVISFPFYLITIFMTLLALATLISYKKLQTQQKLGRMSFIINLIGLIFILIIYYTSKNQLVDTIENAEEQTRLGFGFYCLVIATACSFLANIGIKKDLNLIKSIDRIR